MILVPADSEGFSYTPVHTVAGVGTSATYYDDVRVPREQPRRRAQRRLGADDQPAQPRAGRADLVGAGHPLDQAGARVGPADPEPRRLAGHRLRVGAGRCSAGRTRAPTCSSCSTGSSPRPTDDLSPADASATKVYGSEMATEVYRSLMEIVGPEGAGHRRLRRAPCSRGRLERYYRSSLVMTFGGGTNEIQRDIIGYVGLGLPAASRQGRVGAGMDFEQTPEGRGRGRARRLDPGEALRARAAAARRQVRDPLRPPAVAPASPTPG